MLVFIPELLHAAAVKWHPVEGIYNANINLSELSEGTDCLSRSWQNVREEDT
jgi:hypothetical protein